MSERTKLRPLRDRVLARRIQEENDLGRLIVCPDNFKEPSTRCKVLAVGPKAKEVKVGDVVIIGPYVDFEFNREALVIFNEADVRGVVVENA